MIFYRRVIVGDNERVLVLQRRRFAGVLTPGSYRVWTFLRGMEFEQHETTDPRLTSRLADALATEHWAAAERHFVKVETSDSEVALVFYDGKLARIVRPASRELFWKDQIDVTFERIDVIDEPEAPQARLAAIRRLGMPSPVTFVQVDEGKRGLVFLDGRLLHEVEPGLYGFWNVAGTPRVEIAEMRRQTLEVNGQEILTRDKVSVRVNVSALYEIVDVQAARQVTDVCDHLYRIVQFSVRQYLGKRTLEEILAEKTDLDAAVAAEVREAMEPLGVRVGVIALKDVILPGEMREILNGVVMAEKEAQAGLIRRREEVASTRSLLNTARLMGENPLMVRLKELEALEKIADKVGKITVVGGMNSLLERTLSIQSD